MARTFLEISVDDRHHADLEQIAEDTGATPEQVVEIATVLFIKSYEKEQKR